MISWGTVVFLAFVLSLETADTIQLLQHYYHYSIAEITISLHTVMKLYFIISKNSFYITKKPGPIHCSKSYPCRNYLEINLYFQLEEKKKYGVLQKETKPNVIRKKQTSH